MKIMPILDLCHFGVPDWIGDFQNEDWPHYFAEFARQAAARYDWIEYFTPVNEIFVAALYSGRYGYWNEGLKSQKGFVRAITNLCRANVMAMNAISDVRKNVKFVQSESTRFYHAKHPAHLEAAHFHNEQRFIPLDLTRRIRLVSKPARQRLLHYG
jgi:beta-glucosidase/6-phospho-beta-glucosidase/beta-galactosidase